MTTTCNLNRLYCFLFVIVILTSCSRRKEHKEEQIRVADEDSVDIADTTMNSISGTVSWNQIASAPNTVVLTGLPDHRLVTVYKQKPEQQTPGRIYKYSSYNESYYNEGKFEDEHFMPGIDIIYGYNLLNLAHYDLKAEKLNFLFSHPVLVKTLYFPCYEQDSLDGKPINRNFFLVSVYDEDTNRDTLLNRKDLRRFYHFDSTGTVKTKLVPDNYSAVRSEYDPMNDVMYIFARHDENKNGVIEKTEPMHVFWVRLKEPTIFKKLYQ